MKLPQMSDRSIMRPKVQTRWGGINHNKNAGGGEIYDMENMSSREYPLLAPRMRRSTKATLTWSKGGIGAEDALWWIDGVDFYYDGVNKGEVYSADLYQFAVMNNRVLIWPNRQYYDITADAIGSLNSGLNGDYIVHASMTVKDGEEGGETIQGNVLHLDTDGIAWPFITGDQVCVTAQVTRIVQPEFTVLEVDGKDITLSGNVFAALPYQECKVNTALAAGNYWFNGLPSMNSDLPSNMRWSFHTDEAIPQNAVLRYNGWDSWDDRLMVIKNGEILQTLQLQSGVIGTATQITGFHESTGEVYGDLTDVRGNIVTQVHMVIPDLDYICVCENRLWGCKGDTIYASALGDPARFFAFDGLSTDSWTSDTMGPGDFTGCICYRGKPIFFKQDAIFKIQGDMPSNFYWTMTSHLGVKAGCAESLAIVGDTLFYLSRAGICAYQGGAPVIISEALGANAKWSDAVGGSDGVRYYVSMTDSPDGWHDLTRFSLFVYDTRYGGWWRQEYREPRALGFAFCNDGLYMRTERWEGTNTIPSKIIRIDGDEYGTEPEGKFTWKAEFGDETRFYETTDSGSENKKGLLRLQIRCELEEDAVITISVSYDGGEWEQAAQVKGASGGSKKFSYNIPLILRRCDYYRLKIEGTGDAVIYSIAEVKYSGSNLQGGQLYSQGNA